MDDRYITVEEAAQRLGVDGATVRRALLNKDRGIEGIRMHPEWQRRGYWLVDQTTLDKFQLKRKSKPTKN